MVEVSPKLLLYAFQMDYLQTLLTSFLQSSHIISLFPNIALASLESADDNRDNVIQHQAESIRKLETALQLKAEKLAQLEYELKVFRNQSSFEQVLLCLILK
jgi:hypothetical protein